MATVTKLCHRCMSHYTTKWMPQHYCSDECRFMSFVELPVDLSQCWIWNGAFHGKEYGHFKYKYRVEKAHRMSFRLFKREPGALHVLHKCDNPKCVNPEHLFLGTNDDNLQDRQRKQRQARGESHSRAKINAMQAIEIRNSTLPRKELAKKYGLTINGVNAIISRRSWKHV